jgi:hypothetical protein
MLLDFLRNGICRLQNRIDLSCRRSPPLKNWDKERNALFYSNVDKVRRLAESNTARNKYKSSK